MNRREGWRTAAVLGLFAVAFVGLTVSSYVRESATVDEPQHLTAGYAALKLHDFRLSAEHPPLVRLWAALPLLVTPGIKFDTKAACWQDPDQWEFAHQFLYRDNNADVLLYRARFMIVLLGVVLGLGLFCWARERFGFWPAVAALGLYTLEPNMLAHARLVTTDFGLTCFLFLAIYFLWRASRELSTGNLVGLTLAFCCALATKFSGILLAPLAVVLLAVPVWRRSDWCYRFGRWRGVIAGRLRVLVALLVVIWLGVISYGGLWAVYGFRYSPIPGRDARLGFHFAPTDRPPRSAAVLQWLDDHRLLPNACPQGMLAMLTRTNRQAFLMGEISRDGWWYYFPVAFLIKTPLAVLVLFAFGVGVSVVGWRGRWADDVFVYLPAVVVFVMGVLSRMNIGLRHILPVYPFVLLSTAGAVAALMAPRRAPRSTAVRRWMLGGLGALAILEFVLICPDYLAFFNLGIGGSRHGHEYLVDSNLDWGQDLKQLKRWMDDHQVTQINLSYFGLADPAYYGIRYTPLIGCSPFLQKRLGIPRLPGWLAVSATNLHGDYRGAIDGGLYAALLERPPQAVLGHSIYLYWVDRPWW